MPIPTKKALVIKKLQGKIEVCKMVIREHDSDISLLMERMLSWKQTLEAYEWQLKHLKRARSKVVSG